VSHDSALVVRHYDDLRRAPRRDDECRARVGSHAFLR
jgi:hypothetical protein